VLVDQALLGNEDIEPTCRANDHRLPGTGVLGLKEQQPGIGRTYLHGEADMGHQPRRIQPGNYWAGGWLPATVKARQAPGASSCRVKTALLGRRQRGKRQHACVALWISYSVTNPP